MKTIAFYNLMGGVGKATLVYHLAWMFSELGLRVIAVDLDPQSNLTLAFLPEDRATELWAGEGRGNTILAAVRPLLERLGDVQEPLVEDVDGIGLIAGDPGLYAFEDRLNAAWPACLDEAPASAADAFQVMSALHRVILRAADQRSADIVLIDLAPSLSAISRAALVAADFVLFPVRVDFFSLSALRSLGARLRELRDRWALRRVRASVPAGPDVPAGRMEPIGYVALQLPHAQRAPARWLQQIPSAYQEAVLGEQGAPRQLEEDPNLLAMLRDYQSLMLLAQEAHKPIFALRPADGAIGAYGHAVADAHEAFERLARRIAERSGIEIS